MFDWSNDDEILTDPPPSMKEPPRNPHAGEQPWVGEEVCEAPTRKVPEQRAEGISTQQTMEVPTGRATKVPGQRAEPNLEQQAERAPEQQAELRSTEEEPRIPPLSMGVDPAAAPGGSGRHSRFKKLNRQTKP